MISGFNHNIFQTEQTEMVDTNVFDTETDSTGGDSPPKGLDGSLDDLFGKLNQLDSIGRRPVVLAQPQSPEEDPETAVAGSKLAPRGKTRTIKARRWRENQVLFRPDEADAEVDDEIDDLEDTKPDETEDEVAADIRYQGYQTLPETDCNTREVAEVAEVAESPDVPTTPVGELPSASELLQSVETILRKYVVFPHEHHYTAVTLWIAHCHAIKAFDVTGRLAFMSPEKASGKTRALEIVGLLVPNPVQTMNASVSAIFRSIDKGNVTIEFDEVDTIFFSKRGDNERELTGLINSGYERGGYVLRTVRKNKDGDLEAGKFQSFCPVVLAGLHRLPDTIASRSIVIRMRPRTKDEVITRFRRREVMARTDKLRDQLTALYEPLTDVLSQLRPEVPDEVDDRAEEIWEPLLAIALNAGGDWYKRAYEACSESVAMSEEETITPGIQLLKDIRSVFGSDSSNGKLTSRTMIAELEALPESMWTEATYRLDERRLSQMLKQYGITSVNLKIGTSVKKGYKKIQFQDSWSRYLKD